MGSMNPYSNWPIPPYIQQCRQQQPFGGLYPGPQSQHTMNAIYGMRGGSRQEDLQGMLEWKCNHCGSPYEERPEKCKGCGSTNIVRTFDPGEGARNMTPEERLAQMHVQQMQNAFAFGPIGIPPKEQSVSEAVAEFRDEVAAITGSRQPRWLSRCWSRFLNYLDGCGYKRREP